MATGGGDGDDGGAVEHSEDSSTVRVPIVLFGSLCFGVLVDVGGYLFALFSSQMKNLKVLLLSLVAPLVFFIQNIDVFLSGTP